MATVAGKIQSLTGGKFFVKDEQGNIKEVSLNDDIYENSSVYGDSGNPSSAKVEIILSDNDVIVLSQGQKQLIDASLIETAFGTEELFFTREGLEQTIAEHNAIADVESDLREAKFLNDGNITEEETTEGEEEVEDEEGEGGQFSARDGAMTDIESDLRKKAWAITRTFNESERSKDLEGLTKKELGSNPSNPFTPTPVTPPPSTRPSTDNPPVNPNRPDSGGQRPDEPTPPKPPVVVPPTPTESAAKLSIDDQIIWEQDGQMWFTVTLDKPLRGDVTFTYKTSSGTATEGKDYIGKTGTITIPAGSTSVKIPIDILDDYFYEKSEYFNIDITNITGNINVNESKTHGTGTILDNPPTTNGEVVQKDPNDPTAPGKPDGEKGTYGPEDTVLIRLSQDATTQEFEGATLTHKISLVESDGTTPVILEEGKTVTVTLKYTDKDGMNDEDFTTRYKEVTITGDGKTSEFFFTNIVKDDFYAEGTEKYEVSIESITSQKVFENLVIDKDNNLAKGEIIDNEPNKVLPNPDPTDPSVPGTPKDPSEPKDPNKPTEDKGYGEEDTVYVVITTNDVKYEGETLEHTIQLVDKNGNLVTIPEGEEITVQLVYKDGSPAATEGVDYTATKSITFTSTTGNTIVIKNPTKDDYFAEGDEHYIVEVGNITQKDGKFENIEAGYSQSYKDKNNLSEDAGKTATGTIKDNPGNTEQPVVDPENPGTPDKPKEDGTPVYGPEDTVYVKIINSGSVTEAPADTTDLDPYTLKHKVQLVDKDGNPVEIPAGKSVTVVLEYKDIDGKIRPEDFNNGNITEITNSDGTKSYQWTVTFDSTTPKNAQGIYEIEVKNPAIYDNKSEGTEKYELTIGKITQSDKLFENIVKHPDYHTVTGEIVDKVATPVSIVTPEDTPYNYKFEDQTKTISEVWINNGENFVKVNTGESVDLFDNGKKVGTLTYDATNKQLVFIPVEDYSNYAQTDAIKFKYQAKFTDGTDEFKEVKVQVTPVADKPTITVNNVKTYEDASTWSDLDTGNDDEGGNKIPLGLIVPSLSEDTTDKNNGGTNPTATGDHPERNGEITLTFTNGSDLVLKDSSDNTISGSGAKLIYTTTENGLVVEKELLINSDNQTVQVVIVKTSGGTDIDRDYHHEDVTTGQANTLYLTKEEYAALKIQHAEDNDTNISIKIGVSSYEVDDTNKPLASVTPASDEKTMIVEILPVTDKITIVWDTAIVEGNTLGTISKENALFTFKTQQQSASTTTIDLKSIMSNTSGAQNGTGGTHGDLDGSELRTYTVSGLPEGAVVTIGGQTQTVGSTGTVTIELTAENNKVLDHSDFKIDLPAHFYGKIEGKITLSVQDKGVEETGDSSKWGKTETDSIEFVYKVAGASFGISQSDGLEDAGRGNSNYENNKDKFGSDGHISNGNITDPTAGIDLKINPKYILETGSTGEKITVNIAGLPKGSAMWIKDNTGVDRLIGVKADGSIVEYTQSGTEWTVETAFTGDKGISVEVSGTSYTISVDGYKNSATDYPKFIPPHNESKNGSANTDKYNFAISGKIEYKNGEDNGADKTLNFTDANGSGTFPMYVGVTPVADEPLNTALTDDASKVLYLTKTGYTFVEDSEKASENKYIKAVEDIGILLKDIYASSTGPTSYDADGSESVTIKITLPSGYSMKAGTYSSKDGNTYLITKDQFATAEIVFPTNKSGASGEFVLQYITDDQGNQKTHFKDKFKLFIEAQVDGLTKTTATAKIIEDEDDRGLQQGTKYNITNKIPLKDNIILKDTDGSEKIKEILVEGVPTGYKMYDATTDLELDKVDGKYIITKELYDEDNIKLVNTTTNVNPNNGTFDLKFHVTITDTDGYDSTPKEATSEITYTITSYDRTDEATLNILGTQNQAVTNNVGVTNNGNILVDITGTGGSFTINTKTTSDDIDSEKVMEYEIRDVPDGVSIEGATWLYQTAENKNVWEIKVASDKGAIDGSGYSSDIKFNVNTALNVGQNEYEVTIITKIKDANTVNVLEREQDSKTITLKYDITGGGGTVTAPRFDLSFEKATIYEDNDNVPSTPTVKDNQYFIGDSIKVNVNSAETPTAQFNGKVSVIITDLPAGVVLTGGGVISYEVGGKTYYAVSVDVPDGTTGKTNESVLAELQAKLNTVAVNLPADKNSGQELASGKFLEMEFSATIKTQGTNGVTNNSGTPINVDDSKTPIIPVTDKMAITVTGGTATEDTPFLFNVKLENTKDGNRTELVGNKLIIKITETWSDTAEATPSERGTLTHADYNIVWNATEGYYEATPKTGTITVGEITGFTYTPPTNRAGKIEIQVSTQNIEKPLGSETPIVETSSSSKEFTIGSKWDMADNIITAGGKSEKEDTAVTKGGVTINNAVKVNFGEIPVINQDKSEKFVQVTLDGIPNGMTVYYVKDGKLEKATSAGASNTLGQYVLNPNASTVATDRYKWQVPANSDGTLPEIYVDAPANWSGEFEFKAQFTMSEYGQVNKTFDAVSGSKIEIVPFADGVTGTNSTSDIAIFEWQTLNLNAQMTDNEDRSEVLNLKITGLSSEANFQLTTGSNLDANYDEGTKVWSIKGIKFEDMGNVQFMDANASSGGIGVKGTTQELDALGNPIQDIESAEHDFGTSGVVGVSGSNPQTGSFTFSGKDLDFSKIADLNTKFNNVGTIDLSHANASSIKLSLQDVLDLADSNKELIIKGGTEDKVTFANNDNWTKSTTAVDGYFEYTNTENTSVKVKVQEDITNQTI